MSERPLLRPIPETKAGVILREEACEVQAGKIVTRTECRVVFDVTDFPSASVEIPDIDVDAYLGESVSIRFIDSGYELHEGRLSGTSLDKRPSGFPFRITSNSPNQSP